MKIIINNYSMIPIYEQIIEQIKTQIMEEKVKEGDILPSVRGLAKELRISALTVKKAYDFLEKEGFISTVHGKGSYVNGLNKNIIEEENRKKLEEGFSHLIKKAQIYGLTKEEIVSLFNMMAEDIE
ncbi:GntR family transcriptional regulator [Peptostreptococcaceae bacterium OttesenSCG-928-C18]|nr:GntR family transcriptional regulator [Peptostreptococcaceae bacterium OttesenSCG-928-C18]